MKGSFQKQLFKKDFESELNNVLIKKSVTKQSYYHWSNEELDILKTSLDNNVNIREIMKKLPYRSYDSVSSKLNKISYSKRIYVYNIWTEKEVSILKQLRKKNIEYKKIMDMIPNHTRYSIEKKASKLFLSNERKLWTNKEIQIIKKLYGKVPVKEIMKHITRTEEAIYNYVYRHNLVKKRNIK